MTQGMSEFKIYSQPTPSLIYHCNQLHEHQCYSEDLNNTLNSQYDEKLHPELLCLLVANKITRTNVHDTIKLPMGKQKSNNIDNNSSSTSSRISLSNVPTRSSSFKNIPSMYLHSGSSISSTSKLAPVSSQSKPNHPLEEASNNNGITVNNSKSNNFHNNNFNSSHNGEISNGKSSGNASVTNVSIIDSPTTTYPFLENNTYSSNYKPWDPKVILPSTYESKAIRKDLINAKLKAKQLLRFFDLHDNTRYSPEIYTSTTNTFGTQDVDKPRLKNSFCNFSYCEVIYGEECIPPLVGHSTAAIGDKLVIMGGVRPIIDVSKTRDINDKSKDISEEQGIKDKVKVKGVNYPYPLNGEMLNNPWYVNNEKIYTLDNDTGIVRTPALEVNSEVPPCLCFASCTVITDRYLLYYGGFEIKTALIDEIDSVFYLERDIEVNSKAWIFDIITFKFVKIDLEYDEQCGIQGFPINLARFAHSVSAPELQLQMVNNQDNLQLHVDIDDKLVLDPKSVEKNILKSSVSFYVFGGYTCNKIKVRSKNNKKKVLLRKTFAASSYFFKIKIWFITNNTNNSFEFITKGKYSFIEAYNKGPTPRGFHASILLKESNLPESFSSKHYSKMEMQVNRNSNTDDLTDHIFLVHGGTNLSNLFGDLWRFNFNTMTWKCVNTKSPKFVDGFPDGEVFIKSDLHRANHSIVMLNEYLLFIGGFNTFSTEKQLIQARRQKNRRFAEDYKRDWMLEVQDVLEEFIDSSRDHKSNCNIFLDLNTCTWYFPRLDEGIMEYIDYQNLFDIKSKDILSHLQNIIFEGKIDSIENFIHEANMDQEKLLDLLVLLKQKQLFFEDRCTIGGTVSFINRKLYSIGGLIVPKHHYKNSKKLLHLVGQNIPVGFIITCEMPVFVQPFLAKSQDCNEAPSFQ